ncbi:hypothetical protein DPMN_036426 [Dreissena polymorpha]|uniref:Uncharacterized protein n=1 Tax=Dreissena polymorpha TaxID=45954 RepID=A0A9D4RNT8_DREPO|nr:hypothetical protein DPMN_036426 [Dreissena polymorpha]
MDIDPLQYDQPCELFTEDRTKNVLRLHRNYLYDATPIESVSSSSNPFLDRPIPTDYHCTTNKEELRSNVIELAEDGLGLTGNGIPTGTMGKLTRFELDKDGIATG